MKKFIKFIVAIVSVFTLGLFISFATNVNAEEITTTTETTTTEITTTDEATTEIVEEDEDVFTSILNWLKDTDIDTLRNGVIAIGAYLGVNYLTILIAVITLVRNAIKKSKEDEKLNALESKLTAKQRETLETAINNYDTKLEELANKINNIILNSDEEKKQLAISTVSTVSKELEKLANQIGEMQNTTNTTNTDTTTTSNE